MFWAKVQNSAVLYSLLWSAKIFLKRQKTLPQASSSRVHSIYQPTLRFGEDKNFRPSYFGSMTSDISSMQFLAQLEKLLYAKFCQDVSVVKFA